jgi:hypothetical protein
MSFWVTCPSILGSYVFYEVLYTSSNLLYQSFQISGRTLHIKKN